MSSSRTSFHFPREAAEQLNSIKAQTYMESGADVIRAALSAYDDLLKVADNGGKIFVRDKGGKEWPYSPYTRFTYPGLESNKFIKISTDEQKHPRNFFFSGEAIARLESIKSRSYVQTNADAIRVALTAYNELIAIEAAGDNIIIRDADGQEHGYNPHAPLLRKRTGFTEPSP